MDSKDLSGLINLGGTPSQPPSSGLNDLVHTLVNDLGDTEVKTRDLEHWLTSGPPTATTLTAFVPALVGLCQELGNDLKQNQFRLLSLNRTRREEIVARLQSIAGTPPQPTELGTWMSQNTGATALGTFFEEVALACLGQALVLKAWADRGIRPILRDDLTNLNWTLANHLKRFTACGRDTWQLTRPNIYSWYSPPPSLQGKIWDALQGWNLAQESPAFLVQILRATRRHEPITPEHRGYDFRFFRAFWESLLAFGLDVSRPKEDGPVSRPHQVYCPTLRDGSLLRAGPTGLAWHGLDADPFLIFLTELSVLWQGPQAAPSLSVGLGIECQAREQLSLGGALGGAPLGNAPPGARPSMDRLSDLESCDLAIVLEERALRMNSRSIEAARVKRVLEQLEPFKKMKIEATSLGTLQALTATAKLRPEGLLFWFREEPLHPSQEGSAAVAALFERTRLVGQWDLSQMTHSLPTPLPLFPKHLVLLARDPARDHRLLSIPKSFMVQGTLRSHVEVPLFLHDVFHAAINVGSQRNSWQIHSHDDLGTLNEWLQAWPDGANPQKLDRLERMRRNSIPLGQIFKIRANSTASPQADLLLFDREEGMDRSSALSVRLRASESLTLDVDWGVSTDPHSFHLRGDDQLLMIVGEYLRLSVISTWLEQYQERRRGLRILKEEQLATLPVPLALTRSVGTATHSVAEEFKEGCRRIRAQIAQNEAFFRMIGTDRKIRWGELVKVLPASEKLSFAVHPSMRISGNLPPGAPIIEMRAVRVPRPLYVFATESGLMNQVLVEDPLLLDVMESSLEGVVAPTWNELVQSIAVPRNPEVLRQTAHDLLNKFSSIQAGISAEREILERLAPQILGWSA